MSPKIAEQSIAAFEENPKYFWIDDVYVTGVLAARAGVNHVNLRAKYSLSADKVEEKMIKDDAMFAHLATEHRHQERIGLWQKLLAKEKRN